MLSEAIRALRRASHELTVAPLAALQPLGPGLWRATDAAAVFELRGDPVSGWVEIECRLTATRARLLVDDGRGFSTSSAVPLPLARAGLVRALVRLPERVAALRLQIDGAGDFELSSVRVRELGSVEATTRLLAPVVRQRLREPWTIPQAGGKLLRALRTGGLLALSRRLLQKAQHDSPQLWYAEWRSQYAALSDADRAAIREGIAHFERPPRFSILMPVFETPEAWLTRAIESVRGQLYPHWELCIADDASSQPQVRRVLEQAAADEPRIKLVFRQSNGHISAASNSALALATGDYVALLDHDDALTEHALYALAAEIAAHRDTDLVYSDEDKLDEEGQAFDPLFKPDWNPDLFLSQNYLAHLCAVRRSLVTALGGFREGFEGSQDYDLFLRVAGRSSRLRHVPNVLYHWRAVEGSTARAPEAKGYAEGAARRALQEHLGSTATVEPGPLPTTYRIRWPLPQPRPLVSLLIPTRDGLALLEPCVETLIAKTAYRDFELVVIDNQSREPATLAYLQSLEKRGVARVLRYDRPFNFAALNNFAAREARGTLLGLLNDDLEIIDPGWLTEMVSQAVRPGIGAVGARLLYPDRTLQHGGIILGIGGFAGHAHKNLPEDAAGYFGRAQLVQDVSAVTAACLVIRRETWDRAGGLDETFAVAFNDVDFCLRVRETGLRNLWTPFATLIHHESKTRGHDTTREKRERLLSELERMKQRWGAALLCDPAYNPNLTLDAENFGLAWPPRTRVPWK